MSTVRIYRSTDPGAPPHPSSVRGSMAALLRACLVTGWTSGDFTAEPAGWEEPYTETNNYACFRALSGVRQFYQIDDNQANADVAKMRSYDSMSDAQTGSGLRGENYFGKWYNATYATEWVVIADEKTCYVNLKSQYGMVPHGFGEFYSLVDADAYKGFLVGHAYNVLMCRYSYAGMMNGSDAATQAGVQLFRTIDGTLHASSFRTKGAAMPSGAGSLGSMNGSSCAAAAVAGASYPVFPAWRYEGNTICHGKLRGVYYPGAYRPKTHGEQFSWDGKTMLSLDFGGNSSAARYLGQIWYDISGSWEESA